MASKGETSSKSSGRDYWAEARRPLHCLVFLIPLLAAYEVGVLWVAGNDADYVRNGADTWMRTWLNQLGFNQPWLLPALVVAVLVIWHVAGKYPGRVSVDTLVGMFAESLLFAFLLIVFGQLQDYAFQRWGAGLTMATSAQSMLLAVTYIGAGVYEEVLFRLCLLPVCYGFFRLLQLEKGWAAGFAIVATSVAFSLAHYVGPSGEEFRMFTFAFRALAGLFFALLFVCRGFGIAVGCHAAYDLLVGILLDLRG
ncbi:MAG: lysostaphin resistance A-like protein [Planctomycetaceae bacterium]